MCYKSAMTIFTLGCFLLLLFLVGRVVHLFSFFVLCYYLSLRSEFRVVMCVTISS